MKQKIHLTVHSQAIFERLEPRQLFSAGVESLVLDSGLDNTTPPLEMTINESSSDFDHSEQADALNMRHELIIIDAGVEDYDLLVNDILGDKNDLERNIEVVVLDSNRDGIDQISSILADYNDLDAIHLLSHGNDGFIELGNQRIDDVRLSQEFEEISRWAGSFSENGEILIYGCNLAATESGQAMVNTLAALTNTDVAASDDVTGSTAQGGDWQLEYYTGSIETTALNSTSQSSSWQGTLASENLTGIWGSPATNTYTANTSAANQVGVTVNYATPSGTAVTNVSNNTMTTNSFFSNSAVEGATSLSGNFFWDTSPEDGTSATDDGGTITVTVTFDQEVIDPIIHIDRLGGIGSSVSNSALWTLTTAGASLVKLAGVDHLDVTSTTFQRTPGDAQSVVNQEASANRNEGTAAGSIQVTGTFTTLTFAVTGSGVEGAGGDGIEFVWETIGNNPLITSDGGGNNAAISVIENTNAVTTVTATDEQSQDITYSISGGADASYFSIDSNSGQLRFISAPDYETPADADADNIYDVTVRATDTSGAFDTQQISVTVQDDLSGPTITNPGNQTTPEDTNLIFSTANGNALSLSDDAGTLLTTTLNISNGVLTLATTSGLSFSEGDGTNDSTITFTGSVEDINAALDGMVFTPANDFNGTSQLSLSTENNEHATLAIDNSLQARYTFDESDPGSDSSPSGAKDGIVNGATQIEDSERGTVLDFDGNDDYVEIAGLFDQPETITLATWINVDAGETTGHLIVLGDSVGLGLNSAGSQIHGWFYDGTSFLHTGTTDTAYNLAGDGWQHLAYTLDTVNNIQRFYLNGELLAETTYITDVSWTLGTNTYLGSRDASSPEWAYSGLMDDARIYDRALTTDEIAALAIAAPIQDETLEIQVTPLNDAPAVTAATGSFNYYEGYGVVPLGGTVNITDVDSSDFDGGTLIYQLSQNGEAEDRLALTDEGPGAENVNIDGTNIYYSDVLVGTYTGSVTGSTPLVVTFNGNASVEAVNEVARNITYENTSENPIASTRTIEGYVTDGDGGTSNTITGYINVVPVNDAPQGIDSYVSTTEDSTYTFALSDFNYSDLEDDNLSAIWFDDIPSSGSLIHNGVILSAGDSVSAADIQAGLLTYQPASNINGNNADSFTFRVQDDGGTDNFGSDTDSTPNTLTINIAAVNDAPVITSDSNLSVVENTTTVATLTSNDVDGDTVTYTITGGADAALFSIDSNTGELLFDAAPDFESPVDADGNNIYDVQVTANDGNGASDVQNLAITVTDSNETPTDISPNGFSIPENTDTSGGYSLGALSTIDPDSGDTFTYTIVGGPDAAVFAIGGANSDELIIDDGVLDYETQALYQVVVQTTDAGGLTYDETLTLTITDQNDAPIITSASNLSVVENTTTVATLTSNDVDGDTVTYTITGGADAALFSIDSNTGELIFDAAPDFESPADADGNNIYDVQVTASDGNGASDVQNLAITVTDSNETPTDIAPNGFSIPENTDTSGGYSLGALSTIDPDSGDTFTYTIIGGPDAAVFSIGGANNDELIIDDGLLDYETQALYQVVVQTTDAGGLTYDETITLTITDQNEGPAFTSTPVTIASEDAAYSYTLTANDPEGASLIFTADTLPAWLTLTDNGDGTATLSGTPSNDDVGDQPVAIRVSDGVNQQLQSYTLSVVNTNDAPVITSASNLSVVENTTTVATLTSNDVDGDTVTYTITGGADAALFSIDSNTGELIFDAAPDFESPADVDGNNIYDVQVTASDGNGASDVQNLAITVTNSNEAPTDIAPNGFSIPENTDTSGGYSLGALSTIDPDSGDTFTYTIIGGPDAAVFSIGGANSDELILTNGVLDFERQSNYAIDIQSVDSQGNLLTKRVQVTTSDVDETARITSIVSTNLIADETYVQRLVIENGSSDTQWSTITLPSWLVLNQHEDGSATLQGIVPQSLTTTTDVILEVTHKGETTRFSFSLTLDSSQTTPVSIVNDGDQRIFGSGPDITNGHQHQTTIQRIDDAIAEPSHTENSDHDATLEESTETIDENTESAQSSNAEEKLSSDESSSTSENLSQLSESTTEKTAIATPFNKLRTETPASQSHDLFDQGLSPKDSNDHERIEQNYDFESLIKTSNPVDNWRNQSAQLMQSQLQLSRASLSTDFTLNSDNDELWTNIRRMQLEMEEDYQEIEANDVEIHFVTGAAISVTAGFVGWIFRGSALLSSLLSSVKVFQNFDPLAIVSKSSTTSGTERAPADSEHQPIDEFFNQHKR